MLHPVPWLHHMGAPATHAAHGHSWLGWSFGLLGWPAAVATTVAVVTMPNPETVGAYLMAVAVAGTGAYIYVKDRVTKANVEAARTTALALVETEKVKAAAVIEARKMMDEALKDSPSYKNELRDTEIAELRAKMARAEQERVEMRQRLESVEESRDRAVHDFRDVAEILLRLKNEIQ